jgi:hypothetical protein
MVRCAQYNIMWSCLICVYIQVFRTTLPHQRQQIWHESVCLCQQLWPTQGVHIWRWFGQICLLQVSCLVPLHLKVVFTVKYFLLTYCLWFIGWRCPSLRLHVDVVPSYFLTWRSRDLYSPLAWVVSILGTFHLIIIKS